MNTIWQAFVLRRQAKRLAMAALEETWSHVRAKAATLPRREAVEYIRSHAATVAHRHVDQLVRDDPTLDSAAANQLIVRVSERLTERLAQRTGKLRQGAA